MNPIMKDIAPGREFVSSDSINAAVEYIDDNSNKTRNLELKKYMNSLQLELIKIQKAQQNSSSLIKHTKNIPLVGTMLQRYAISSLENKLDDSKQMIYHLKETIDKKCQETKVSSENLYNLARVIKSDIDRNKKEKTYLEDMLNNITDVDQTQSTNSKKAVIGKQINELTEYISILSIQEAQIENILKESTMLITSIEFSAKKALACIATSIVTHQHVELERSTMELVKKCNSVVGEVLLGTAQSIKEKSEEFQNFLINASVDPEKIHEAIEITKQTFDNMVKFNNERLPLLLENVKKSSQSIKEIENRLNYIKTEKEALLEIKGGDHENTGLDKE